MTPRTIDEVRRFWETSPLWSGESRHAPGTAEFFQEHERVMINDCFAGRLDERVFPTLAAGARVLDVGCGPGFWLVQWARRGRYRLHGVDLTRRALDYARERCRLGEVDAAVSQQNAERLAFADASIDHVNCQGVIHHTPNTERCVAEIARVLKRGGTASISVYYRNALLRSWPVLRWPARLLAAAGAGLRGRGREGILRLDSADEIVRCYDGADNPIGRAYSRGQFADMLGRHLRVEELFVHFFPARAMPVPLPRPVHRLLDRWLGFMLFATVRKG